MFIKQPRQSSMQLNSDSVVNAICRYHFPHKICYMTMAVSVRVELSRKRPQYHF